VASFPPITYTHLSLPPFGLHAPPTSSYLAWRLPTLNLIWEKNCKFHAQCPSLTLCQTEIWTAFPKTCPNYWTCLVQGWGMSDYFPASRGDSCRMTSRPWKENSPHFLANFHGSRKMTACQGWPTLSGPGLIVPNNPFKTLLRLDWKVMDGWGGDGDRMMYSHVRHVKFLPQRECVECSVLIGKFVRGDELWMLDFSRITKQRACLLLLAGVKDILTDTHSKDKK
jgi:hypothetical protein